jgi:spoIIIJ-associated protein
MEWVETTGKTVAEALEQALDRLGVAEDDAEFEVLEEPKTGLFGRVRGEARVRARVRPTAVRPKQDRRNRGRGKPRNEREQARGADGGPTTVATAVGERTASAADADADAEITDAPAAHDDRAPRPRRQKPQRKDQPMDADGDRPSDQAEVSPEQVGAAGSEFMTGLATAFGSSATATVAVDGSEIDVRVDGDDLGLLIGPGGRTLMAVQDLARVAAQRRLGDHDTRLRVDVAGYRERRRVALEKFATAVANEVLESGTGKALEPMASADRKVVHDTIQGIDGVTSHSDGEDPRRRVVITPA